MPDKEKLIKILDNHCDYAMNIDCNEDCANCLADHLIANGVTIQKHGRWLGEPGYFKCSCCGKYGGDCGFETSAYCPNCGAKMEG